MDEKLDIIAIGESLIELSSNTKLCCADSLHKYYGGDALATAIAALRAGSRVGFITRVGNDVFKDFLMDSWQSEGLDISQVKLSNEQNG
uniref:PfkB family carbohydrate kinase n=1 Tax=Candidatus Scatousia sp. TaxID=3085663 RepID=UPI00402988B3